MTTLAFDTTSDSTFLAIERVDGEIFERGGQSTRSHNEELGVLIKKLLRDSEIDPSEIKKVIVGVGPGSFTGIRIGLSTAKGIALANFASLVPLNSLAAFASEYCVDSKVVVSCADARRDELFLAAYERSAKELKVLRKPAIVPKASVSLLVEKEFAGREVVFVSDGIDMPGQTFGLKSVAKGLISLARQELGSDAFKPVQPEYLRAVAARKLSERL